MGYLLRYILDGLNFSVISGIVIITDQLPHSKRRKAIEKAIKTTIEPIIRPLNKPYIIVHHASKSSYGFQVVDYCNWAIYRKWERSDTRNYDIIKMYLRSEFDIFKTGDDECY